MTPETIEDHINKIALLFQYRTKERVFIFIGVMFGKLEIHRHIKAWKCRTQTACPSPLKRYMGAVTHRMAHSAQAYGSHTEREATLPKAGRPENKVSFIAALSPDNEGHLLCIKLTLVAGAPTEPHITDSPIQVTPCYLAAFVYRFNRSNQPYASSRNHHSHRASPKRMVSVR